jgi:hypothetical protein
MTGQMNRRVNVNASRLAMLLAIASVYLKTASTHADFDRYNHTQLK